MKNHLFIIALCAVKVRGNVTEITGGPASIMAASLEAAKNQGIIIAKERWLETDGWTGHAANGGMLTRQQLMDALAETVEDPSDILDCGEVLM